MQFSFNFISDDNPSSNDNIPTIITSSDPITVPSIEVPQPNNLTTLSSYHFSTLQIGHLNLYRVLELESSSTYIYMIY